MLVFKQFWLPLNSIIWTIKSKWEPKLVGKYFFLIFSLLCPDYALRHPSQMLKSSYYFFFQLPHFPELMLSINDFKVSLTEYNTLNIRGQ